MPHETPLIATIVAGLGLAFVFGAIAQRLRMPPIVGYLFAGILVGPHTPGFIADLALAQELSELGIILLMFGVGLHFSIKDLWSVRWIAIPGAIVQIAVASALGAGLAHFLGWSFGAGLIFGLALSVASTVVLLRALQERRLIQTDRGRVAVGWLVVEDLAMVLALVLLPALAGLLGGKANAVPADPVALALSKQFHLGIWGLLGVTFGKVIAFVALMLVVGRRLIPWILHVIAQTGSRELFRLAVLAIALGVAFGAAHLFGVSLALGAFFAGMIMSESELSHQAAEETLPLRDAFSVLFFVAVGMLFNPQILLKDPLPIAATLFIVLIGKSAAAFFIVRTFRHPIPTALTISASLAQIGEFSFILADLGIQLGVLPKEGRDLILAGALISIIINPIGFAIIRWMGPRLERSRLFNSRALRAAPVLATPDPAEEDATPEPVAVAAPTAPALPWPKSAERDGHVVLVGYGRVGSLVAQALREEGRPFVVIEDAEMTATGLQAAGIDTIYGNAASKEALAAANLAAARQLVIAIPNAFEAGQIVEQARRAYPVLEIVARARSDAEVQHLSNLGASAVIVGEREIARSMIEKIEPSPAADPVEPEPDAVALDTQKAATAAADSVDKGPTAGSP